MGTTFGVARWAGWLTVASLVTRAVSAHAQAAAPVATPEIYHVFQTVAPSVLAIRAHGRDAMTGGQTRFTESGSGVLISGDGTVLTAAYVVHGMDEISVQFADGQVISARVVASEPAAADLSLLQLDRVPPGATVSPMADSNGVKVGDKVLVVGAPYRLPHSLSIGSISARWPPASAYRTMPLAEFFQTDATIDTGNSGGPMFNLAGEVIGIVSDNIARGDRGEGRGFVVTSNTARHLLLEQRSAGSGLAQASCTESIRRGC